MLTVLITGGQEFWGPGSSQGLRMARAYDAIGCRVLYIECGGEGRLFREKTSQLPETSPGVFRIAELDNFYLARVDHLPLTRLSFPGFARRIHCRRCQKLAEGFLASQEGQAKVVAMHFAWFFPEFMTDHKEVRHVYECLDDHSGALNIRGRSWRQKYVRRLEGQLLARADLSVFSSPLLAEQVGAGARRAKVLPLGVEYQHFASKSEQDLNQDHGIASPRIGFLGQVTDREDWAMVARAAGRMSELQWVVLGPGSLERDPPSSENLIFAGPTPYQSVPDWLSGWQAAFVPLADSEFNRAAWPLKFYELLAAGLPVAATPIPAAKALAESTNGLVVPAAGWGADDFCVAIKKALELKERAALEGPIFAAKHSWQERARDVLKMI
jgi:glycosyltransferase involved in cell wall biosynthesis